ncbi:septum formation initiator family protein [Tepidibacter formicigenes]|jgi:cell division protein FtsL|uniref:Cell division protein FtsL n=1 Tax=Tepidibacter formicigenes DSM 15518 TaxID=1123349 RepID=A0A1M6KB64_9FIRM|nr:septum formation initiator family protein [Tepidibacter formicigenes]SHJ56185.1 cell division protein FtsL [Tepidibacter formicigenes DSM 15518]
MKKNTKVSSLEEYRKKKLDRINSHKNNLKKKKNRKLNILSIFGLFILCIIIIFMYRYSIVSSLKYEVQSLNKELENKKNKKKQLYLELDNLSKSGFIEKEAKERINMIYPTDEQTVYIKVD